MRDPMLPVSPMSNDGSLWHKPTSAPAGLDCCSRPFADPRKVCFLAAYLTIIYDRIRWLSAYLLLDSVCIVVDVSELIARNHKQNLAKTAIINSSSHPLIHTVDPPRHRAFLIPQQQRLGNLDR